MKNADIILHHYHSSPFAEKVRLALRLKNLAWSSVEIPPIMPKPDLTPLTGGYRLTPVVQIGADIICDSNLILRELERRFPEPELINPGHEGIHAMVAAWADGPWCSLSRNLVFAEHSDRMTKEILEDRESLFEAKINLDRLKADAPMMRDQWRANLYWIEERLEAGRGAGAGLWLFGTRPGMADIHAYMNVWFLERNIPDFVEACFKSAPRTFDWYERLRDVNGQTPTKLSSAEALAKAKEATPRLLAASAGTEMQPIFPGSRVGVCPADYGKVWVEGELVSANPNRVTLQKVEGGIPTLHVHFPRAGYLIKPLD